MKALKKLKYFFESNLDGYDVALAIIGSLIGVVIGTAIFWLLVKQPVLNKQCDSSPEHRNKKRYPKTCEPKLA